VVKLVALELNTSGSQNSLNQKCVKVNCAISRVT
jgi:hypothetical protein